MRPPLRLALLALALTVCLAQDASIDDAEKARVLAKALAGALPNTAKFGYGGCCTTTGENRKAIVSPIKPGAPGAGAGEPATGVLKLGLSQGSGRDGYVFVPPTYNPAVPAPLIVTLHGANKTAFNGMATLADAATAAGAILVAPSSRDPVTWDLFGAGKCESGRRGTTRFVCAGGGARTRARARARRRPPHPLHLPPLPPSGIGTDVAYINASIAQVSDLYNIDPVRVAIQGFSDGATYALTVGAASGKTFTHVIAFSPGGLAPPQLTGNPAIFISAGLDDAVFPYANSAAVVCQLVANQYVVDFLPFKGGHAVPENIANAALQWFVGGAPTGNVPAGTCT